MTQYRIIFEFADKFSGWEWRKQECYIWADTLEDAAEKCLELYGLGVDCYYHIITVEIVGGLGA